MGVKRPSHATVVAYLALFVALGGSAYAVHQIGSKDIANDSIRAKDLKDHRAVAGREVRRDTLTGGKIQETTLDAAGIASVAAGGGAGCDPTTTAFVACSETAFSVSQPSKAVLLGSAGFFGSAPNSNATCQVLVDGELVAEATPGQVNGDNTDGNASDGFTASGISFSDLASGSHQATLQCNEVTGDAKFSNPSIVVIALGL